MAEIDKYAYASIPLNQLSSLGDELTAVITATTAFE